MPHGPQLPAGTAPREARALCGTWARIVPARSVGTPRGPPGSASPARYTRSPSLRRLRVPATSLTPFFLVRQAQDLPAPPALEARFPALPQGSDETPVLRFSPQILLVLPQRGVICVPIAHLCASMPRWLYLLGL